MTAGIASLGATDMNNQQECVARVTDQNMISFFKWYIHKLIKLWT